MRVWTQKKKQKKKKKKKKKTKKQLNGNQDTKPEINKDINTLSKELLKKTGDDGSVKTCYSESSQ